ncbi:hypothetical protein AK830_g2589 [Neonectria ditissima]|uniref:Uncharacterized protein n=1 Tax=Neonectria ditissima TaxID=78410 RepID=A0A0P7BAT1_9HYPO|nr:hypothetical protein AK830_g2589 [Neonectria ditissima]
MRRKRGMKCKSKLDVSSGASEPAALPVQVQALATSAREQTINRQVVQRHEQVADGEEATPVIYDDETTGDESADDVPVIRRRMPSDMQGNYMVACVEEYINRFPVERWDDFSKYWRFLLNLVAPMNSNPIMLSFGEEATRNAKPIRPEWLEGLESRVAYWTILCIYGQPFSRRVPDYSSITSRHRELLLLAYSTPRSFVSPEMIMNIAFWQRPTSDIMEELAECGYIEWSSRTVNHLCAPKHHVSRPVISSARSETTPSSLKTLESLNPLIRKQKRPPRGNPAAAREREQLCNE